MSFKDKIQSTVQAINNRTQQEAEKRAAEDRARLQRLEENVARFTEVIIPFIAEAEEGFKAAGYTISYDTTGEGNVGEPLTSATYRFVIGNEVKNLRVTVEANFDKAVLQLAAFRYPEPVTESISLRDPINSRLENFFLSSVTHHFSK